MVLHGEPRGVRRRSDRLAELAELLMRLTPGDGVHTGALPRVALIRSAARGTPLYELHEPALCVIAQGKKQVMLKDEVFVYDPARYLLSTVDLPLTAEVLEASTARPYLCVRLALDVEELSELLLQSQLAVPSVSRERGIFLQKASDGLIDATLRLVRLSEEPDDIPLFAPLVTREIVMHLLKADHGGQLRKMAVQGGQAQRIARVVRHLREHHREPLRIEALARMVHMSPSSLHHQFKALTAMSPLQYQKRLRLQEARRLLLSGTLDAARVGREVGYESASQFSREFARLFGAPPLRDARKLRAR